MHLVNSSVKGPENKFVLKPKIIIKMYLKIFFTSNDKLFIVRISIIKSEAKNRKEPQLSRLSSGFPSLGLYFFGSFLCFGKFPTLYIYDVKLNYFF